MNWKTWLVVLAALVVGVGVVFTLATRLPAPPAHQVFINGEVITVDNESRVVEAIALRGDRIEAVGTTDEIMALVEDQTVVHDLRGTVLFLKEYVATLRSESYFHRIGQGVHTPFQGFAGVFIKDNKLCHNFCYSQ